MFGIIFTSFNNRSLKKKLLKQIGGMYFSNYSSLERSKKEFASVEEFERIKK